MRGGAHPRRAFSLVELLAVVVIILLLLSLLVPLTGLLRERANEARCTSNLRQIIAATNLYTGEKDGFYPDAFRWVWSDGTATDWAKEDTIPRGEMFTGNYLRDRRIFLCPTFARVAGYNPVFANLTPHVGYSMNEYMASTVRTGTWSGQAKIKRAQIIRPGTLGVFGDEGTVRLPWAGYVINNLCLGVGAYSNPGHRVDALGAFHRMKSGNPASGDANVAYADGSVRASRSEDSKEIFTPEQYK